MELTDSKEQLVEHFQSLSKRLSWDFKPPEYLVNRVAYSKLRTRNESEKPKALPFFIMNTENFPKSFNAFDSLGEAYEVLGDKKNAIENYEKSLDLNPGNEQAIMKIKSLK